MQTAAIPQGDARLLDSDVARRLPASTEPARLAYVAADATPRVLPSLAEEFGERGR
jgi:hypothetical protein